MMMNWLANLAKSMPRAVAGRNVSRSEIILRQMPFPDASEPRGRPRCSSDCASGFPPPGNHLPGEAGHQLRLAFQLNPCREAASSCSTSRFNPPDGGIRPLKRGGAASEHNHSPRMTLCNLQFGEL